MKNLKSFLPLAAFGALALTTSTAQAVPPSIVIAEVYGGGGGTTAGAPWINDYVELYNNGVSPFDLGAAGYSLQYFSAAGLTASTGFNLSGVIPAHQYFFVEAGDGGTVGAPIPAGFADFDASGVPTAGNGFGANGFNISNSAAKIGLFSVKTPATVAAGNINTQGVAGLVDFVGIGTAGTFETAASPAFSRSSAVFRTNVIDTNNNSLDFTLETSPTLRNSAGQVIAPVSVPEPSALLPLVISVAGMASFRLRRKK